MRHPCSFALRAVPALLLIALVAACSRGPEAEHAPDECSAKPDTEVVVIAKDDAAKPPPQVVLMPELAAAVVTPGTVTEDEIKDYVRDHLARYKVPREVVFIDELPRNPTGKILKRELRQIEVQ